MGGWLRIVCSLSDVVSFQRIARRVVCPLADEITSIRKCLRCRLLSSVETLISLLVVVEKIWMDEEPKISMMCRNI